MGGIYTLVLALDADATIEVGALGALAFDRGYYAYTGSALGPGGFARVDRHQRIVAGEHDARHWHVDYLLGHPGVGIDAVGRSPGSEAECATHRALAGDPVPGVGASDCDCGSHLRHAPDWKRLVASVRRVHDRFERER